VRDVLTIVGKSPYCWNRFWFRFIHCYGTDSVGSDFVFLLNIVPSEASEH
jgi:hypothetical protein